MTFTAFPIPTQVIVWSDIAGPVPDGQVSESSVTQHQAALTILEAQIPDLGPYQAQDGTLTALAALTTAADQLIYTSGPDTFLMTALTTYARQNLLTAVNATALKSGLAITMTELADTDLATRPPASTDRMEYNGAVWIPAPQNQGAYQSRTLQGGTEVFDFGAVPFFSCDLQLNTIIQGAGSPLAGRMGPSYLGITNSSGSVKTITLDANTIDAAVSTIDLEAGATIFLAFWRTDLQTKWTLYAVPFQVATETQSGLMSAAHVTHLNSVDVGATQGLSGPRAVTVLNGGTVTVPFGTYGVDAVSHSYWDLQSTTTVDITGVPGTDRMHPVLVIVKNSTASVEDVILGSGWALNGGAVTKFSVPANGLAFLTLVKDHLMSEYEGSIDSGEAWHPSDKYAAPVTLSDVHFYPRPVYPKPVVCGPGATQITIPDTLSWVERAICAGINVSGGDLAFVFEGVTVRDGYQGTVKDGDNWAMEMTSVQNTFLMR